MLLALLFLSFLPSSFTCSRQFEFAFASIRSKRSKLALISQIGPFGSDGQGRTVLSHDRTGAI